MTTSPVQQGSQGPAGPQGPPGPQGPDGPAGPPPTTVLTAGFTQPSIGGTVAVHVATTSWMVVGGYLSIAVGGEYSITSIADGFNVTITNIGSIGNATPTTTVPSGGRVTASGAPGAGGPPAATSLTANFTQPSSGTNATAQVATTAWMVPTAYVFLQGGGLYTITSVTDATHVVLNNTGIAGNAVQGTVVPSGNGLVTSGPPATAGFQGVVYVQPIDGTSDDSINLEALTTANANKKTIVLCPGNSGQAFQINNFWGIPNGTHLRMMPGVKIQSNLNNSTPVVGTMQMAPLVIPVLQATQINLHDDITQGAKTFTTTFTSLVKGTSAVQLLQNTGQPNQDNGLYFVKDISSPVAGVFTVTVDRPISQSYSHTADTLAVVTFLPRDIFIEGNGATVTGTTPTNGWLFACSGAYNVKVWDLNFDSSGGQPGTGGGIVLLDTSSFQCEVRRCKASNFTCGGGFFIAPCENIIVDSCKVEYCNFTSGGSPAAFFMLTCVNSTFTNCTVDTCSQPGFVFDGNSINCGAINCVAWGSAPGFALNSGTNIYLTNCRADYNSNGIVIASPITNAQIVNCSADGNTGDGLLHGGAPGVQVVNFKGKGNGSQLINGGGPRFVITNVDITGNPTGMALSSSVSITGLTYGGGKLTTSYVLQTSAAGILISVNGFQITETASNTNLIGLLANSTLTLRNGVITLTGNSGVFPIQNVGASVIHIDDVIVNGSGAGGCGVFETSGGVVYVGVGCDFSHSQAGFTYFGPAKFVFAGDNGSSRNGTLIATTYTVDGAANNFQDNIVKVTGASSYTITLPAPSAAADRTYTFVDADNSATAHAKTIATPSGSIFANGTSASSVSLNSNGMFFTLWCDGTNYLRIC